MPVTPHIEKHFTATATVRDIVIGMADGLTVPFALAAGLSGAVASSGLVVTAGLAEIAAGSIAMGLGGYLAAKTDLEHYASERLRELRETQHIPEREAEEVSEIFRGYGLRDEQIAPLIETLQANPTQWVDFMMRFELGLEEPDPTRARISAWTIALSYVVGGLIPLLPYMVVLRYSHRALVVGGGDSRGSVCIRLREKRVYRRTALARRVPNRAGRRSSCGGRFRNRPPARLRWPAFTFLPPPR
jgi:VIT1/CCC1 family predicted Fe2+/Mn2+ transporter